jgi:hypothetical protein
MSRWTVFIFILALWAVGPACTPAYGQWVQVYCYNDTTGRVVLRTSQCLYGEEIVDIKDSGS